jgi:peptidoglycan biosynthesis protein MviN/MurJ (putative lipid II flippase)
MECWLLLLLLLLAFYNAAPNQSTVTATGLVCLPLQVCDAARFRPVCQAAACLPASSTSNCCQSALCLYMLDGMRAVSR